jgi:phospholipid/cholesterol/gamma-HCH transport system substrate-binding protein
VARPLIRFALFAALTLGLTVWIGAQIAKVSFEDRYQVTAEFDDVSGLFTGDDVKLAGVVVGKVDSIRVVDGRAIVRFAVNEDVLLPVDTVVAVRWRNLIGQRYIGLEAGSSNQMVPIDGDAEERVLPETRSVVDLGQLVNRLGPLAQAIDPQQINDILLALVQALEGNSGNVDQLIGDLDVVLATLADRDQTIGQLIADYDTITGALARRDQQIQAMVDNLLAVSSTFADNRDLLDRALVELGTFTSGLDTVLSQNSDELGRILDGLAALTDTARENLGSLETSLLNLPAALSSLFSTVDNGEYIGINVTCLNFSPAPCLVPITLPPESGPVIGQSAGAEPAAAAAAPRLRPASLSALDELLATMVGGAG